LKCLFIIIIIILLIYIYYYYYWRRSRVVRTLVSAGKLSLSCARLL